MINGRVLAAVFLLPLVAGCSRGAVGSTSSSGSETQGEASAGNAATSGDDGGTRGDDGDAASDDGDPTASDGSGDGMGDGMGDGPDPSTTGPDGCRLYGAPDPNCCEGETPLQLVGIDGSFCSPECNGGVMCPPTEFGDAQCALGSDPMAPTNCAILCDLAMPDCPPGASCKDTGIDVGICTYP